MSQEKDKENIIKTQEDHKQIHIEPVEGKENYFKLSKGSAASWISADNEFDIKVLRTRIEPWFALFQSEHLSLLAGSGLTHAVHYIAAEKGTAGMDALEWPEKYKGNITSKADTSAFSLTIRNPLALAGGGSQFGNSNVITTSLSIN